MVNWLSGWTYRKPNTISANTGRQFKIIVHSGTGTDTPTNVFCNNHVNNNFSDLRFTLSDGVTLLNYVIDSFVSGVSANVYLETTFSGTQIIYLYYGNSAATNIGTLVKNTQQLNGILNLNDAVPVQGAGGCNVYLNQSFSATMPSNLYEARVAQKGLTTYAQATNDANGVQADDMWTLYIDGVFQFAWSIVGNACGITGTTYNSSFVNKSFNITTTLSGKLGNNVTFNVRLVNYQGPQQWGTSGAVYLFAAFDFGTWGAQQCTSFDITSNPTGAEIYLAFPSGSGYIDQNLLTESVVCVPTSSTTYDIKLAKGGYQNWVLTNQSYTPGGAYSIQATLTILPGSLAIFSDPTGAEIYLALQPNSPVDQNMVTVPSGTTISNLTPGIYNILLRLSGYQDWTGTATVVTNSIVPVSATFAGSAYFTSVPTGAEIFLASSPGAPIDRGVQTPYTINNLTNTYSGATTLWNYKLTLPGYYDVSGSFTATAAQTVNVATTLTPLPGNVTITSTPSGARIYIDNIDQGIDTPNTIYGLIPGNHGVKLTYPNYYDYTSYVDILSNQTISINPILSPIPGNLHVTSSPLGTRIYLDNIDQSLSTEATITNLSIGDHTVRLTHPNYQDFSTTITINPNQTTSISPSLTISPGITRYELVTGFYRPISHDYEIIDFGTKKLYWNGSGYIIYEKTIVDDKIIFNVTSGTGTFTNQYSPCGGVPLSPVGPFDITNIFSPGFNDLNTQIQDMCGVNIGTWGIAISGSFNTGLSISSTPIGARIWLAPHGETLVDQGINTNSVLTLDPGNYDVMLRLAGYIDWTVSNVAVISGETANITATLTPAAGNLSISSVPEGAEIWIDNVDLTKTTTLAGTLITNLSAGTHNVKLILAGYDTWTKTVTVISAITTPVYAALSPYSCTTNIKYSGGTVTLKATPRDGVGPYYVEFKKDGLMIDSSRLDGTNPISSAQEDIQIVRNYILNDADIAGALSGSMDFSVYMIDSCPPSGMTCEDHCTVTIGCISPVCNFIVT